MSIQATRYPLILFALAVLAIQLVATSTTNFPLSKTTHQRKLYFNADGYSFRVLLEDNKLKVRGYSAQAGRMFNATIENRFLTEKDKYIFEDCEGMFNTMQGVLVKGQKITFHDAGDLRFQY